ncbi:MAG: hypothetical protein LBG58_06550 [Planctomycetaceae bacterium]|nr:hypothetical protein [Planctomycetaceae bacterium]
MRSVFFVFCLVVGSIGQLRIVDGMELPSLSEIATAYQEYLQRTVFISFDSEEHGNHHQTSAHVDICQNSVHFISKTVYAERKKHIETEWLLHNDTLLQIVKEPEKESFNVYSFHNPSSAEHILDYNNFFMLQGVVPLGSTTKRISVSQIISSGQVKVVSHKEGNSDSVCLAGILDGVEITCFLNRKYGYVLERCRITKKPEMVLNEIISFDGSFDRFISVNGVWLPTSYTCKILSTASKPADNGTDDRVIYKGESNFHWTLSNYRIASNIQDQYFKIQTNIPNWTKVSVMDAPQIDYVWFDGEIVPLTDEIALARIRGHGFIPGVREPRFWFIAAGIFMVTLALGLKIRDFFRNRKNRKG